MLVLAAEDDLVPSKLVREMLLQMNHPCEVRPCNPLGYFRSLYMCFC